MFPTRKVDPFSQITLTNNLQRMIENFWMEQTNTFNGGNLSSGIEIDKKEEKLKFSQPLYPYNCSEEEFDDITERMVTVQLESIDLDRIIEVYEEFKEVGNIETQRVETINGEMGTLKFVYKEIEHVFELLTNSYLKAKYDFFTHVMDMDGNSGENNQSDQEQLSECTNLNVENDNLVGNGGTLRKLNDFIIRPFNHSDANLRFNDSQI